MTIIKQPAASGSRALLKNGAPATVPEEEEGYLPQNPAPAPAPAAATKPNVPTGFEDDEGYLPQPAPAPVAPKPASSVPAGFEDDEGYLPQPAAGGNQPTPAPAPATAPVPSAQAGGIDSFLAANSNSNSSSNSQQKPSSPTAPDNTNPVAVKPPSTGKKWETKMLQCGEPATGGEIGLSLIPCISHAIAKTKMEELSGYGERASCLYNCCCWHHAGSYAWVRNEMKVDGLCGEDMMASIFCSCCVARRMLTEVRLLDERAKKGETGVFPNYAVKEEGEWVTPFFGCSGGGCLNALLCWGCAAASIRAMLQPRDAETDCCFSCLCLIPCSMYGTVRQRYNLEAQMTGNPCIEDVCLPLVLFPCALDAALREARERTGGMPPNKAA